MNYEFTVSAEGLVDVALADDLPLMSDALKDSIGTRPPRGAPQDGPSTYWIDRAIQDLQARIHEDEPASFAAGNVTYLQLRHGIVEARYDFDTETDAHFDAVPADELLALLMDWRTRVMEVSPTADKRMPPPPSARAMPRGG